MKLTVARVGPYDGSYELNFADELTTREFGWIKRLSGYLPLELDKAVAGGDPEFMCVLVAIAMCRAGKIDEGEVPQVFERLLDVPFSSAITVDISDEPEVGDAGPPARSSTGNGDSSGTGSTTSSETSLLLPSVSGTPASGSSPSDRLTSAA